MNKRTAVICSIVLLIILILCIHFWLYFKYLAFAGILSVGGCIIAWKMGLKSALLLGLILFIFFGYQAYKSAYFRYHIPYLEQEFVHTSHTASYSIDYQKSAMDFGGKLDDLLLKRNNLLRSCGYVIQGWWATSTDGSHGKDIMGNYVWSAWTIWKMTFAIAAAVWGLWYLEKRGFIPREILLM